MTRTSDPRGYPHADLTERIIGCGIEVHRALGPGLPGTFYQRAMEIELELTGLRFERKAPFKVRYKGQPLGWHEADLDVESTVLIELKAIDAIAPVHRAIAQSCLRISRRPLILIMNFKAPVLKDGLE